MSVVNETETIEPDADIDRSFRNGHNVDVMTCSFALTATPRAAAAPNYYYAREVGTS